MLVACTLYKETRELEASTLFYCMRQNLNFLYCVHVCVFMYKFVPTLTLFITGNNITTG